jgi:hypothetical protein
LERYRRVEDKMNEQKITKYAVENKYSKKVENYLGKNSREYGFSSKKGEEGCLCFSDNQKRIFAILDMNKNNLKLASSSIKSGIEEILKMGRQN